MGRINRKIWVLSMVVVAIVFLTVIIFSTDQTSGAVQAVDWNGAPTIRKTLDLAAAPDLSRSDCRLTTLPVVRGLTPANESACMTTTNYGSVNNQGELFQPAGHEKAYPLDVTAPGRPVLKPIPGRDEMLYINGNGFGSVTLGYYNDIYSHLKYKLDFEFYRGTFAHYVMADNPDGYFQYSDRQPMQMANIGTSPAGRFVVVNTVYNGIGLVDMDSKSIRPVLPYTGVDSTNDSVHVGTLAVDNSGKFVAAVYDYNGSNGAGQGRMLKVADTSRCSQFSYGGQNTRPDPKCPASDMYPYLKNEIAGLEAVLAMKFINNRTIQLTVRFHESNGSVKYAEYSMLAAGQQLNSVAYEALGDSYTSGEGAYSYRLGTDTERNRCHQSTLSYPYLLGQNFDSFASLACSGARLHNIGPPLQANQNEYQLYQGSPSNQEKLAAEAEHIPGYLFQKSFIEADNPQAVTVSIGGNDVGFGNILAKCVHPLQKASEIKEKIVTVETCYDNYEDRVEVVKLINSQFTKLRRLYQDLKQGPSGPRRVYVVGYPQVAKVDGNCGFNVQMNREEIAFAAELVAYLNSVVKQAADQAGVRYVDILHALDGHMLCEASGSQLAANGFTINNSESLGRNFTPSFHPTALGQRLVANSISNQTARLTAAMPEPAAQTSEVAFNPQASILQNLPKSGRVIRAVRPVTDLVGNIISLRAPLKVVTGARDLLLRAASNYSLVLNSQPITLATAQSDAQGNVTFETELPATVEPGVHTLHIYGQDIFDNPIDIQQTVYVAASETDYDGDGVDNGHDSCTLAVQSGADADNDGVDDACDSEVVVAEGGGVPDDIVWLDRQVLTLQIDARRRQDVY